jgi:hypothetical protein
MMEKLYQKIIKKISMKIRISILAENRRYKSDDNKNLINGLLCHSSREFLAQIWKDTNEYLENKIHKRLRK